LLTDGMCDTARADLVAVLGIALSDRRVLALQYPRPEPQPKTPQRSSRRR
jgi:hypothetical protein